jgi:hypothetical protein
MMSFYLLRMRGLSQGQTALSLVLVIGGIVIFVGLTLSVLALSFVNAAYGFQAAQRAYAVALAGIEDGLLQIARRGVGTTAATTGRFPSGSYTAGVNTDSVTVGISWDVPSTDFVTITATSSLVAGHQRGLQLVASVNPYTGQVVPLLWNISNQ